MKAWAHKNKHGWAALVRPGFCIALVIVFAVTVNSSALTAFFYEAESGTLGGQATRADDLKASNGQAATFGSQVPTLLWGIGDQLGPAQQTPIYQQAPVNMVTGWFNGPNDLSWMAGYDDPNNSGISNEYGKNKAIELVVWVTDGIDSRPASQSATAGKTLPEYALSQQFLTDLARIVNMYEGHGPNYGPLYVVLYTEFNATYVYNWPGSPYTSEAQYNAALMAQYQKAVTVVHSNYNQAKVALGFGGYSWNPAQTVNLAPYEAAINASDFTAVQAMQSCLHADLLGPQIKYSVKQLGSYGKPVMISHFKIWNDSNTPGDYNAPDKQACATNAFASFQSTMFNDATLNELKGYGLFAWDFMSDSYINNPGPQFDSAKTFIGAHAAGRVMP